MLNNLLLPYTADIKRPIYTKSWWEETKSYTVIYSSVPCRYYSINKLWLEDTDLASETSLSDLKVILPPANTNIYKWDKIEIFDADLLSIWTFLIKDVKAQRLISSVNHMALEITKQS